MMVMLKAILSGPTYKILKVDQGSFHQGDIRFGETAGRQGACKYLN